MQPYLTSGQSLVYNPPTSISQSFAQFKLEQERVADQEAITEFERTSAIWARHQAPLNVAKVASWSIPHKYNGLNLLDTACRTIRPMDPCDDEYFIPKDSPGNYVYFAQLVLHVFAHFLSESRRLYKDPDIPDLLPDPSRWSTIFPAYPILEAYQDRFFQDPSFRLPDSRYLDEEMNPGITLSFTLLFLALLQERREDPLVVLAVYMQMLSYVRFSPVQPSRWIRDGMVTKEDMDEFLSSLEVREWFDSQPETVREECERVVEKAKLITREERLRNTMIERKRNLAFWRNLPINRRM